MAVDRTYTARIDKTVEGVPTNPTGAQANEYAAQIAPQVTAITSLLDGAAKSHAKRNLIVEQRNGECD